jgi:hypothetical protein
MNDPRFDFFKLVRFFTDINDLTHSNVPSLQETDSLSSAWLPFAISALRSRMECILAQNVAVSLYACNAPASVETLRQTARPHGPNLHLRECLGRVAHPLRSVPSFPTRNEAPS